MVQEEVSSVQEGHDLYAGQCFIACIKVAWLACKGIKCHFSTAGTFPRNYGLLEPIPSPDPTLDTAETHDLVLKSQLNKDILKGKKAPAIEELAKMFYTTKHRWYPVGQYHTRRKNRNPPKDR
ncbi:39S ribosomal protein L42, mitochondrial isoform X2 [Ictalurus furcatus]|uniref:39S ribosomal protein L42, mitochondrial isoform X2 n=1 Tax=Ictalurus furcatus TaxID=66913 RepID=UPI002350051A|nr:39S ribosomal protein L42, mitochondrial isoform X2 [Ictalurus furcatus]